MSSAGAKATSALHAAVSGTVGKDQAGKSGVFTRHGAEGAWRNSLAGMDAFTVTVDPDDPRRVLAGTADGVWVSSDQGLSFARSRFPGQGAQVWSILFDNSRKGRILAGGAPLAFWLSEDGGQSWLALPDPGIKDRCKGPFATRAMRMAQHPTRRDEIYTALEINGVIRSDDGGHSWTDCSADLLRLAELPKYKSKIVSDSFAEGMLDGHAISISSAEPDAVILACRMGLFRSTDKGRTWIDMDLGRFSPVTYGRDVRIAPQDPRTMFAALSVAAASKNGGLWRSADSGKTWSRFDKVQVHGTIMSVALHPANGSEVYLGARYEGEIYGTRDGGATWQAMPLPGPVKDIYCLACG